ncbi:MAG: hypothetical protein QXK06_05485 [Candidatus Diapherotrites archaeon]
MKRNFVLVLASLFVLMFFLNGCTQPGSKEQTPTPAPNIQTPTPTPALSGPKDCGTDIDCFIKAAENCSEASYTSIRTLSLGFIEHTNTSKVELRGISGGKCLFYLKNVKNEFVFSPEYTQEQKDSVLEMYKKMEGLDMVCKYDIAYIRQIFQDWKAGGWESLDVVPCEGDYAKLMKNESGFIACENCDYNDNFLGSPGTASDDGCPACENCASGKQLRVISGNMDSVTEACHDCILDKDCKKGFHCFEKTCLSNSVLLGLPSCEGFDGYIPNDPCKKYACENCREGHLSCYSGWSNWPKEIQYKCVECNGSVLFWKQCKDGFECKAYKCEPLKIETCDLECNKFHYSNCPEGCIRKCLPSACSGQYCTADCEGPGSCSCP